MKRRTFLKLAVGASALAGWGELAFLGRLRPVSAAEAKLPPRLVQLGSGIEPLVRLLEDTPSERVLEEVAARIKAGLPYRNLLAALLLAGVRDIQPRPVGFKFHAVLVVNSAHLASLASPDTDRWLPIFWAIDQFKRSQAANLREGGWALGPVDEAAVPPPHQARRAFTRAMDNWDEAAADAAIAALARSASAHQVFEACCPYGARDFRDIGHKMIYVANSFRTLEVIGWQHAEPVLRSLAYGLLDRGGAAENPAQADLPADRPGRRNLELARRLGSGWLDGKPDADAATEMLRVLRDGSTNEASDKAVELLNGGVGPSSLFDAFREAAGELLMRSPGILSLHATTFTNALHYAWQHCGDEETRKLLLLQNAAFLPLYRARRPGRDLRIDQLQPAPPKTTGPTALDEIFAAVSRDPLEAARLVLAYLKANPDPQALATTARRYIFLKGRDSHDYKFSSAVFEDYLAMRPPWRDRFLAASVFHLKGSGDPDNQLVVRIRAALGA
jgi:hypothetical protein